MVYFCGGWMCRRPQIGIDDGFFGAVVGARADADPTLLMTDAIEAIAFSLMSSSQMIGFD
jgi:hypothetical protein